MFGGYAEQRGFDPVQGRGGRGIFRYDFTRPREDGREMFFQDKDRLRAPGRRGERKRERAIVSVGAERCQETGERERERGGGGGVVGEDLGYIWKQHRGDGIYLPQYDPVVKGM